MNVSTNRTILITGGNGLLGRHVASTLGKVDQVVSLVKVKPKEPIANVTYKILDLSSNWGTGQLPEQVDAIVHLAQSSRFREFPDQALDVFRVNVESTAKLLDYAVNSGVKQFVYASSGGVYGSGSAAFNENASITPLGKLGYYLGSKLCSEVLVQSYASLMKVVVLRPFFMYGSGQKRSMLIPRLVDNIKAGNSISLQGEDGIRINPIHVKDAANAVIKALDISHSATFNIGGPEVLSLRNIVEIIGSTLAIQPNFDITEGVANDLIGDISSMKSELCSPEIKISNGILDLI